MLTFVVERLAAGIEVARAAVAKVVGRLADGQHGHGVAVVEGAAAAAADHVQAARRLLLLRSGPVVAVEAGGVELQSAAE